MKNAAQLHVEHMPDLPWADRDAEVRFIVHDAVYDETTDEEGNVYGHVVFNFFEGWVHGTQVEIGEDQFPFILTGNLSLESRNFPNAPMWVALREYLADKIRYEFQRGA